MNKIRPFIEIAAKLCVGAFLLLSSIYCLLAFIPYTYLFLIKEPPYEWLIWFSRYYSLLYWAAVVAAVFAYWEKRSNAFIRIAWMSQAVIGIYLTVRNFVPTIQNNGMAFVISLVVLIPLLLTASVDSFANFPEKTNSSEGLAFSYSNAVLAAVAVAVISMAATTRLGRLEYKLLLVPLSGLELVIYILAAYVWLALLMVSLMNLALLISARFIKTSGGLRFLVAGSVTFIGLAFGSVRFLEDTLTFRGWETYIFAVFFSAALTLWGFSVVRPLFEVKDYTPIKRRLVLYCICFCLLVAALTLPAAIGENDWNGLLQSSSTLLLWILATICIYLLRPSFKNYSIPGVLAVLVVGGACYWALGATGFLWARSLGRTDGELARTIENYATQDASFNIAHYLVAKDSTAPCDELCRTLRQYTNVHDARAIKDLNLVDQLGATTGTRPNIFIFVIDSVRRDYIGAYNPRVDFTPNLNAFAADSIVIRNAYSQYAGTSLSEPAIWAGALLLHAHYLQPFARVNSLEKLVRTDGYRMIVSYDEVLRLILPDSPGFEKLDANKSWNELELSDTLRQLESLLDSHPEPDRPIFFYAQPKNVHLFARNPLPNQKASHWVQPPGFDNRASFELHQVDEFLGSFFSYLKSRGLYDNSIIVFASDHGEALGQFGRQGHSSKIFPEIMRVPLIIHLPESMRARIVYDPNALSSLTDIVPSLYYLLGHRPVKSNELFGHPLFTETKEELQNYHRSELFLASDSRAAYGLLSDNGNFLYTTYDSPTQSFLFDLSRDPNATVNILNEPVQKEYEQRVLGYLQDIAHLYDYKPTGGVVAAKKDTWRLPTP